MPLTLFDALFCLYRKNKRTVVYSRYLNGLVLIRPHGGFAGFLAATVLNIQNRAN